VGNFLTSDDTTAFLDGSQGTVSRVGPTWVGRGKYLPGWQWSRHVQPTHGRSSEAHAGYVLSGQLVVRSVEGTEMTIRPGESFYAAPGHDAWTFGNVPCEALDFPLELRNSTA